MRNPRQLVEASEVLRRAADASALSSYPYDALDDLLYDWHVWEREYSGVRGYASMGAGFEQSVSSRQWQSTAELLEAEVGTWRVRQVDAAIDDLSGDHRLAIRIEMLNRAGPDIYRNPRAPDGQHSAYAAARTALRPLLERRGVEIGC